MAQTRARIEEMKRIAKLEKAIKEEVNNVLPSVYACLAKVLYEKYDFTAEKIADVFKDTQETWTENIYREDSMIEWCEDLTGLSLRNKPVDDDVDEDGQLKGQMSLFDKDD